MPFPLTVDLGSNGGILTFQSSAELHALIDQEVAAWDWLPSTVNNIPNYQGAMDDLTRKWPQFNQAVSQIRNYLAQGNDDAAASTFLNQFGSRGTLPLSSSFSGSIINQVKDDLGDRAAVGALATILQTRMAAGEPELIRGVLLAHAALQATNDTTTKSVGRGLGELVRRFSKSQADIQKQIEAAEDRLQAAVKNTRRRALGVATAVNTFRRAYQRSLEDTVERISISANESISDINGVRRTFEEQMRLEAPVTYWRGKAEDHRKKSRWAAGFGLVYAVAIIAYAYADGVGRAIAIGESVIKHTGAWQAGYIAVPAAVFVVTVAIWVGRLISRTYVSQSHLAIDAEERATMVETYLALTRENKISESERLLVLRSLFRASSDGLVRDDGAPTGFGLDVMASRLFGGEYSSKGGST